MSDINRVSGGEQAQQDAIRAAQKKEKPKQAEKAAGQYSAQQQSKAEGKKLKTAFDEVLDNLKESTAALIPQESKFDSALKEVHRDEHSGGDQGKDEEEGTKSKGRSDKAESGKETSKSGGSRVDAKHSAKEQGRGGTGGHQEGGSQKGFQERSAAADAMKARMTQQAFAPPPMPGPTGVHTPLHVESPHAPREMPKALLDQIVQMVVIRKSKELGQEMEIKFHDNFFNGLRLKVTAKGAEIGVEFICPNRAVQDTFKGERDKIAAALGEKGIDVYSIEASLA